MTLVEALLDLKARYELEDALTTDSLESVGVQARRKLVADLLGLLGEGTPGEGASETKGTDR